MGVPLLATQKMGVPLSPKMGVPLSPNTKDGCPVVSVCSGGEPAQCPFGRRTVQSSSGRWVSYRLLGRSSVLPGNGCPAVLRSGCPVVLRRGCPVVLLLGNGSADFVGRRKRTPIFSIRSGSSFPRTPRTPKNFSRAFDAAAQTGYKARRISAAGLVKNDERIRSKCDGGYDGYQKGL